MQNRNTDVAINYHEQTKHSYLSVRMKMHYLDWDNRPYIFKVYEGLPGIDLPRDDLQITGPAVPSLQSFLPAATRSTKLDLQTLSKILFFSAGLTKKKVFEGGEEYWFRAAATTGALYEVEVYVVCGNLPGLAAGVYHFSPKDFKLYRLREGDYRGFLSRASGNERSIAQAPATLLLTAIYWRNTWKYQARAFRHFFWDAGTLTANILATCNSTGQTAHLSTGFVDRQVNLLLGVDEKKESSLCLIALGSSNESPVDDLFESLSPIHPKYVPLSAEEEDYALVREIQQGTSLETAEEVARWKQIRWPLSDRLSDGTQIPLSPFTDEDLPESNLGEVILRRASTRRFAHRAISYRQLSTILSASTQGLPSDFLNFRPGTSLLEEYLIVNAVDGIPAGAYYYGAPEKSLELIREGDYRQSAGFLCLEQPLGADASAVVFFMCNLKEILHLFGNRGYRAAQQEAGIIGGKMYLCSYALGLGASGTTFYDDDVTKFFSPHAAEKSCMFAMCLGRPGKLALVHIQ